MISRGKTYAVSCGAFELFVGKTYAVSCGAFELFVGHLQFKVMVERRESLEYSMNL